MVTPKRRPKCRDETFCSLLFLQIGLKYGTSVFLYNLSQIRNVCRVFDMSFQLTLL